VLTILWYCFRYGRRITIIGAYFTAGIAGMLASFSLNYYMFAALRFIITSCLVGALVISHIMGGFTQYNHDSYVSSVNSYG